MQVPALVAAVGRQTDCVVELTAAPGWTLVDNRPTVPGYKAKKLEEQSTAHNLVLKHLGIDTAKQGIRITLGGDLTGASGASWSWTRTRTVILQRVSIHQTVCVDANTCWMMGVGCFLKRQVRCVCVEDLVCTACAFLLWRHRASFAVACMG